MNVEKVSGYSRLATDDQKVLKTVYAKHMACIEDKSLWELKSVTATERYLKVTFKNGDWLHYTRSGNWY